MLRLFNNIRHNPLHIYMLTLLIITSVGGRPPRYAPPLSSPVARVTEQMQRSSTFPRRIRSHADRCSRFTH